MSAPFRFLGIVAIAWVGVRAASLGLFPGATALVPAAQATPQTDSWTDHHKVSSPYNAPMTPDAGYPYQSSAYPAAPIPYPYPLRVQPIYLSAAMPVSAPTRARGDGWESVMPLPQPLAYAPLDNSPWPVPTGIGSPPPVRQVPIAQAAPPRFDRWQFSTWAMMRDSVGGTSLATGGMLGGSQGGARLTYRFNDNLGIAARFSSALGGRRGAEAAIGLRWQPLAAAPFSLNVERRQKLGRFGGRSDFAAFVEGGLYRRPVTGKLVLDGYAQAGMVGVKDRDWFADGALVVSHPVWKRLSAGMGLWAGGQHDAAQRELYRVDAGPRLSVNLYRGTRLHVDYRQRLVGNALPGSGPTVTFAGDF